MRYLLELDRRLYLLFHGRFRSLWFDSAMVWLTKAGTKGILWLGLSAGLLIEGTPHARDSALAAVGALLLAEGTINVVLKPLVRRERPFARSGLSRLLVQAPGPHSWPSAHAGSSLAAALVLGFAYPAWALVLVPVALLIGYSRVYVGVHYPLDVLAGFVVGLISALVALLIASLLGAHLHT